MAKTCLLFVLMFGSLGHSVTLEAAKGKTEFLAIGRPSALKISGTGLGPTGDLKFTKDKDQVLLNGQAKVDLASLETGIGMRDRHMKEKYLEVEKFKEATLNFKDAKFAASLLKTGGEVNVPATLTLHGKEKPITVVMKLKASDSKITASSSFALKLSAYGIDIPTFSGITVADEVQITTETEVAKTSMTGVL